MSASPSRRTAPERRAATWIDFWGGEHRLTVAPAHAKLRARTVAEDLLGLLAGRTRPVVLDFGCGEATEASRIAAVDGRLLLHDAPAAILERLRARYGGRPEIAVLDRDGVAALPADSLDVVVLSSVIQYLSQAEFEDLLDRFRRQLRPGGELLIGDVIPPAGDHVRYALAAIGSGLRHGYLLAALRGLLAIRFSSYWQLKRALGYAYYTADAMLALLTRHGYAAERLARNIGPDQLRMGFRARKPA